MYYYPASDGCQKTIPTKETFSYVDLGNCGTQDKEKYVDHVQDSKKIKWDMKMLYEVDGVINFVVITWCI